MFTSCSPQKRFNRLVKKHPHLIKNLDSKVIVKDSIYDSDTFIYPGFKDSFQIDGDTVIQKSKYRIEKNRNKFDLQVYPDSFFRIDTIYTQKEITIPGKVIDLTPGWVRWILDERIILAYLALSLTLITLIFKHRKAVE
jgi:hypothetical protein